MIVRDNRCYVTFTADRRDAAALNPVVEEPRLARDVDVRGDLVGQVEAIAEPIHVHRHV